MDWKVLKIIPYTTFHIILYLLTHTRTHTPKEACQKSFPRAQQIWPHQSARRVRDLGDNKPYRRLTDQISTYTSATLLLGQDTHPLSTPGLSHSTKLRLDDTNVERGWKTEDQSEQRAVERGKIPVSIGDRQIWSSRDGDRCERIHLELTSMERY